MNKQPDQASNPIEQILFGDRWGTLRLFFILMGLIFVSLLVLVNNQQAFFQDPALSFRDVILSLRTEFVRYLIAPVAVLVNIILLGGLYVQDIYELENYSDALRFLIAALFSRSLPAITIKDGQAIIPEGQTNLLDVIGGPGWVEIMPGNAVLLENLKRPTRVLGHGWHFIPRFEKIKSIVDLKDQEAMLKNLLASTRDGITINTSDIRYRYRIASNPQGERRLKRSYRNPYPFSEEAIVNYAYRRSATSTGLTEWHRAVGLAVDTVISDYINQNQVDHITAPSFQENDPRDKIKEQMEAEPIRKRLKDIGTELLWVDIGHFQIELPDIDQKRKEAWEANWSGKISLIHAQGEAERIALQEKGRAEGQAAILTSIVNALRDAGVEENDENLANIVLARTAQIIESMTSAHQPPAHQNGQDAPS